jgi:hypothetical protein
MVLSCTCLAQTPANHKAQSTRPLAEKTASSASSSKQHKPKPVLPQVTKEDLDQLKQTILQQQMQQQQRFDTIQQQNQRLAQQLQQTEDKLSSAELEINGLKSASDPQILKLQTAVAEFKVSQDLTTTFVKEEKAHFSEREHPTSLHYKGVNITPGGFLAIEALYRTHAENSELPTSWVGVPYDAQTMAYLGEFRESARMSRMTLLSEGAAGKVTFTGYLEADFEGTGYGSSEVQSNGYSPRLRQAWARVETPGGWTFAGGQMWSLVTTNTKGIANFKEFTTPTIDASQFIANDYARQGALRVTKTALGNKMAMAFAIENPATVAVVPANVPAAVVARIAGLSTTGSGVLANTTYSTNLAPDLIAKVAFDPGFGHYEIKALGRTFRDRLISTAAVAGTSNTPAIAAVAGSNSTVLGGGLGGGIYLPIVPKRVDYILEGMWGNVGRYGATATDVVVKPNGLLSPEKSTHVLTGFLTHPTSKLDWYALGGDEYLVRNYGYGLKSIDNTKCFSEAGFSCSASVKSLAGGTSGIWYRFYQGNYGKVLYGMEYSYLEKTTWSGKGGAPRGIENIFDTSFRYYLP